MYRYAAFRVRNGNDAADVEAPSTQSAITLVGTARALSDNRLPSTTMHDVLMIPQALHEGVKDVGSCLYVVADFRNRVTEAKSRYARCDYMKGRRFFVYELDISLCREAFCTGRRGSQRTARECRDRIVKRINHARD